MDKDNMIIIRNTSELEHSKMTNCSKLNVYISTITKLCSISRFTDIERLNICAMDPLEFNDENVIDTEDLKSLGNLKTLSIENDDHIEKIDISHFKNIESIQISSCHLLKEISGFSKLENLKELIVYDVPNIDRSFYTEVINLISHQKLSRLIIDINAYLLFNEKELELLKNSGALFSEKIGFSDNYVYTFSMMKRFNSKVLNMYYKLHKLYKTRDEILKSMYSYIKSINYDDASLSKRHQYSQDGGSFKKFDNRYKSINSSYKALMRKSAVCEGYVNLLRYFYSLENIDLYPVFCDYKESSHVAAKAFIDGTEVYFDPELDHRFGNSNNYMISKDEFQRNHSITYFRDNFDLIYSRKPNERVR